MSSSLSSPEEFSRAAQEAPPHPLHLEHGSVIIVGREWVGGVDGAAHAGSDAGSRSTSQRRGVVQQVTRSSQKCSIRFDGDNSNTIITVEQLQSQGYTCPDVVKRGDQWSKNAVEFTCQTGHVQPTRTAFDYYMDLVNVGFDFDKVTEEEIFQRGDKSPISKIFSGSGSSTRFKSLAHYMTKCPDTSELDVSSNLSRDFKRFVIEDLILIHRSFHGREIHSEKVWYAGVSEAAHAAGAHILDLAVVHYSPPPCTQITTEIYSCPLNARKGHFL
jgi:hypothetical protein